MKKIIIKKENSGQRIDKFLSSYAKASADKKPEVFLNMEITRGEIIRMIKNGKIKVNNKNIKPSYVLKEGDKISAERKAKSEKLIPKDNIKIKIIYQDKNIIVIDKPDGLKIHPNNFEEKNTLVNFLISKFHKSLFNILFVFFL